MNIRQLQFFVAIVEEGSLTKAALKVRVAQPSLSQHVRQLETDLQCKLLYRGPKGVEPTEAGETLLHHARVILGHVEVARDAIMSSQKHPVGSVRFGLPSTVGNVLAFPLVVEARDRFPMVRVSIAEAMSADVLSWLREGRADLGIIYRTADAQLISSTHVLTEDLWLIAPARRGIPSFQEPQAPFADLARMDLILPTRAHGLRTQVDDVAARRSVRLTPLFEMDSVTQIKYMVEKGLGFGVLPLMTVSQEIVQGRLKAVPIVDPTPRRDLYLAHSAERPLSNSVVAVQQLALKLIRRLVADGTWPAELA